MIVLIVLAVLVALAGLGASSQAMLGPGLIGIGCLFAILARIAQAQAYRQQDREARPEETTSVR